MITHKKNINKNQSRLKNKQNINRKTKLRKKKRIMKGGVLEKSVPFQGVTGDGRYLRLPNTGIPIKADAKVRLDNDEVDRLIKKLKGLDFTPADWDEGIYKDEKIPDIGVKLYNISDDATIDDKVELENFFFTSIKSIKYINDNNPTNFETAFQSLLTLISYDDTSLCNTLDLYDDTQVETALYKDDIMQFRKLDSSMQYNDDEKKKKHLFEVPNQPYKLTSADVNGDGNGGYKLAERYKHCYNLEQYYLIKHIELAEIVQKILNVTRNIYILFYIFNKISKLYDIDKEISKTDDDIYLPRSRSGEIEEAFKKQKKISETMNKMAVKVNDTRQSLDTLLKGNDDEIGMKQSSVYNGKGGSRTITGENSFQLGGSAGYLDVEGEGGAAANPATTEFTSTPIPITKNPYTDVLTQTLGEHIGAHNQKKEYMLPFPREVQKDDLDQTGKERKKDIVIKEDFFETLNKLKMNSEELKNKMNHVNPFLDQLNIFKVYHDTLYNGLLDYINMNNPLIVTDSYQDAGGTIHTKYKLSQQNEIVKDSVINEDVLKLYEDDDDGMDKGWTAEMWKSRREIRKKDVAQERWWQTVNQVQEYLYRCRDLEELYLKKHKEFLKLVCIYEKLYIYFILIYIILGFYIFYLVSEKKADPLDSIYLPDFMLEDIGLLIKDQNKLKSVVEKTKLSGGSKTKKKNKKKTNLNIKKKKKKKKKKKT